MMVFGAGEHQVLPAAQLFDCQTHNRPQMAGQLPRRCKSKERGVKLRNHYQNKYLL